MDIKERCQKYHQQNCDFCEDLNCCDNTNKYLKLQSENTKLKELLKEWLNLYKMDIEYNEGRPYEEGDGCKLTEDTVKELEA